MSTVKMKLHGIKQMKEGTADLENNSVKVDGNQFHSDELSYDVPFSGTLYGTILNYQGVYDSLEPSMHAKPYKEPPKAPILYIKPKNTFRAYGTSLPVPQGVEELEMGAALGLVIGKAATKVNEEDALDYVSGYTVVNDVSIPHDSVYRPAIKEKARDGFCPVGPWVVDRDSVDNPDELGVRVWVNGDLKQENNTANLVRPVRKLMADVTEFMTLFEGDILLVGVPENAPLATKNDTVQIEIEKIGVLENKLTSEKVTVGGGIV